MTPHRTHRRTTSPLVVALPLLLGALLAGGPAAAQKTEAREFRPEASLPVDPQLDALMKRFRAAQATTKTLTARFRQLKEDELFTRPREQTGRFHYSKPGNFRWDYLEPEAVTVLVTAEVIQRYVPAQKLVQQMDVSKNRRRVFNYFGIGSDVEVLRRHFDMRLISTDDSHPGADKLELRGKQRRVQKRITLLEMWIDRKVSLPVAIRANMADGGKTTWEFTGMEVNPDLPEDAYHLHLPKDVVVRDDAGRAAQLMDGMVVEEDEDSGVSPSGH